MERNKILIVDDLESNRMILAEMFQADYRILEADDSVTSLQLLEKHHAEVAVVLLDWHLSGEDGSKVLKTMKKKGWLAHIPVLIVTAEHSTDVEKKCIQMGASDLIRKPFDPDVVKNRVRNNISLYRHKNQMEQKVQEQNEILSKQYSVMKVQAEKLKKVNEKMIDIICNILERNYPEFMDNVQITREISKIIGKKVQQNYPEYKLTDKEVDVIAELSSLRDIGKLLISDHVLYKPAKLTKEETDYMKSHTAKGCEIMKMMSKYPNEKCFEGLEKAIAEKDYEEAFRNAHNLKGVTGNLEMTRLSDATSELVEKLRAKHYDGVEEDFARIKQEQEHVLKAISDLLSA